MFTGLVEEIGTLLEIRRSGSGMKLTIAARFELKPGDSVAVNGVCLTVARLAQSSFIVDAVPETVQRSTLSQLRVNDGVHLERALRADGRFGGHFVQGHVDGIGEILRLQRRPPGWWLTVRLPVEMVPYVVEKGSIALDGVSLTVAGINDNDLSVALVPYTAEKTLFIGKKSRDKVNVELDLIAKYVHRLLRGRPFDDSRLSEWGFL